MATQDMRKVQKAQMIAGGKYCACENNSNFSHAEVTRDRSMTTRDEIATQFAAMYKRVSEAAQLLSSPSDRWDSSRVYRALQRGGDLTGLCDRGRWIVSTESIEAYIAQRARVDAAKQPAA